MKLFNYVKDECWKKGNLNLGVVVDGKHISVTETAIKLGLEIPCAKLNNFNEIVGDEAGIPTHSKDQSAIGVLVRSVYSCAAAVPASI